MKLEDFKSFKIVVNSSDACVLFASEELKKFINESAGYALEIVKDNAEKGIYVGCGKVFCEENLPDDSFSVVFESGSVYLLGKTPRAILYATYDFIEKFFGVRFLSVDYTYVPKISKLQQNTESYVSVPDFALRQYLAKNVENELFSARLRLYSENYSIRKEYGGDIKWNGKCGCNHTLLWMTPQKTYFTEDNKEQNAHIYQLNDKGVPIDICMSDGITDDGEVDESMDVSAFKIVLSTLKNLIITTDDKYFPIGQMDHPETCMCEKCVRRAEKYTRAGLNVIFGNLLMKELRKWMKEENIDREIYLVFFAYYYSTFAPVKRENGAVIPLVVADPNLCVRVAPINANCYYPINSINHFDPFERIIDEWSLVCKNVMIWTYHTHYHCFLWYFPTMHKWVEEMKYFKARNVQYLFMQSNHLEPVDWKANMELYVASKLMWNTKLNPLDVRDEYLDLTFGASSKYVKDIIEIFDSYYAEIAERAQKMRKRLFNEVNGVEYAFSEDISTDVMAKQLRKEAEAEWLKNVYFSIYSPDIGWYENHPIELLERQIDLIEKAKGAALSETDFDRIINEIERVELTIRTMILFNYKYYYGENGYEDYKKELVNLADKLGFVKIGEGYKLKDKIDNLKLNYWL